MTTPVQYDDKTSVGISTMVAMNEQEVDVFLNQITDYLNSNFEILAVTLPSKLAQEVIRRIWDELLTVIDQILIPPLYGPMDKERRLLNARQLSCLDLMINILKTFFHADGEGIGIPMQILENEKYTNVMNILSRYRTDLPRLKRECELGIESGRDKEAILRLVRLFIEKSDHIPSEEKDLHRAWLDQLLIKRKEIQKR